MTNTYSGENIFVSISNNYYHLTNSEKKVADYVLAHRTETQYMSISELAEECGVAEATISRFCRRMKLRGYNDFKLAMAKAVAAANESAGHVVPALEEQVEEIRMEDSVADLGRKLYATHVAAMGQTMSVLNSDSINRAVDMMEAAENVYCMGQGGSMVLAEEAECLFSNVSGKFIAVCDSHRQASRAAIMSERDVVLFFSYSGSTKDVVELIGITKEQGAKVILITRFLKSPGAHLADVVLQCGSNEGPLQLGSVAAKMAQLYLVDILYNEYCRRLPELCLENQERIANALAGRHL